MQVLKEYCEDCFGNAGAAHRIGRKADRAKEEARKKILDLLGCRLIPPQDVTLNRSIFKKEGDSK